MKYLFIVLLSLGFTAPAEAQSKNTKTDTFQVEGICNMCKQRIEDAAYGKGVRSAVWDKETGKLVLIYNGQKTDAKTIMNRVSSAGHNNSLSKSPEKAYEDLPACCQYKSKGIH